MTLSHFPYKNQGTLHSFLFSSKSSVYFTLQDIQVIYSLEIQAHLILLCFVDFVFFFCYKLKICGNPALSDDS